MNDEPHVLIILVGVDDGFSAEAHIYNPPEYDHEKFTPQPEYN